MTVLCSIVTVFPSSGDTKTLREAVKNEFKGTWKVAHQL
jgi:hypothetical protein